MNACTALILLPTVRVALSRGLFATINECDWPKVAPFKWHALSRRGGFSAATNMWKDDGKRHTVHLHRWILGEPNIFVDHRSRDSLNDRRANLRLATVGQNNANSRLRNGLKGVRWRPRYRKWEARLSRQHIGHFDSKIAAIVAHHRASFERYGEFANTNSLEVCRGAA